MKKIVPVLAASVLALSACAGDAPVEPPIDSGPGSGGQETPGAAIPIEGINGTWTFADGTDGEGQVTTDATITLVISGDSLSGQSACNSYAASLEGEPHQLTISSIASTKRACENALMEFDTRYFTALSLVTAATPTGGSLVLQGDGVNLNFVPANSLPEE